MRHNFFSHMARSATQISLVASLAFVGSLAQASDQVGTFTQIEGEVRLFSHPAKKLQEGAGTHVLYEGEYFLVEPVKNGMRVEQGNIVRTAPGGKARVVFENGDQLNIGSATAMRVFWQKDANPTETRMDLAYGKVRGIVEKGGPRSHLQIRTRTATMGVRGTDFFIADDGREGSTEVSIMRGSVQVLPKALHAKPIEVTQGFSADIPSASTASLQPVELRKTTQEQLVGIQKSSAILAKPNAAAEIKSPEIAKLEKKAVETTLKDIRVYDAKLFAQIQSQNLTTTDAINSQVVQELVKAAPKAPDKRKPYKSEVDSVDQGAYEKYFKVEE